MSFDIPIEILVEIYKYISHSDIIHIMSKVASDWRQAICQVDNLVFKFSNRSNQQVWHSIFYCQHITNITNLNLESSGLTDSDIEILCESANNGNFRKLEELMLGGNKKITIQSLHSIINSEISKNKNLNYIFLDNTAITQEEIKGFVESHQDSLLILRSASFFLDMDDDSEGAMKYSKIAAESGDAISQLELSFLYRHHRKDEISSKYWLEKSHQQGYENATQLLAELFGKEGDYKQAFELYSQAAEKGLRFSMLQIAIMYENGQYVGQDYSKSKRWLFKSGNLHEIGKRYLKGSCGFENDLKRAIRCFENSPNSTYELGKMYLEGNQYIQKDAVKAVEVLTGHYNSEAAELLGSIYLNGAEGVPKDIDKAIRCFYRTKDSNLNLGIAYLEKAKTNPIHEYSARSRLTDAANEGSVEAQFRLAEFLRTKNEFDESDRNFTLAASQGHPLAQYQLGLYHKIGARDFERDLEKATRYFRESANQDCSNAQFELALLLIPTNYEEAFKLLNLSIAQGNSFAMNTLGKWYLGGIFVEKDEKRAVELLEESCKIGDCSNSFFELSRLYEKGLGCEVNLEKSKELKQKATEMVDVWLKTFFLSQSKKCKIK